MKVLFIFPIFLYPPRQREREREREREILVYDASNKKLDLKSFKTLSIYFYIHMPL